MAEKRKISIRKIIQSAVTLLLTGCCVFVTLSTAKIQSGKKLESLSITITNEQDCHFIDQQQVRSMLLQQRHIDLAHTTLSQLDIKRMEKILCANPWIANAEVYVNNEQVLNISVTQRVPEFRIFEQNGNSYYVDSSLAALPLSTHYTHYTPVFVCMPELAADSNTQATKSGMLAIAQHIKQHPFWNAQVEQVVLNKDKEFELIPILGRHRILLGDTSRLEEKFENVFAFYKKILDKIGWDRYELLDVRYKGQVVASPSLPWKAPVDKALSNMNWVKTIIGDAAMQKENSSAYPLTGGNNDVNTADSISKGKKKENKLQSSKRI